MKNPTPSSTYGRARSDRVNEICHATALITQDVARLWLSGIPQDTVWSNSMLTNEAKDHKKSFYNITLLLFIAFLRRKGRPTATATAAAAEAATLF